MKKIDSARDAAMKNVEAQADLWRSQMKDRMQHYEAAHENTIATLHASESPQEIAAALKTDALLSW